MGETPYIMPYLDSVPIFLKKKNHSVYSLIDAQWTAQHKSPCGFSPTISVAIYSNHFRIRHYLDQISNKSQKYH